MVKKIRFNKKICVLLIIVLLTSSFIGHISKATDDEETITYKVEQIKSRSEINSDNLYQYIIVYEREGINWALGAARGSGGNFRMGTNNAIPVTIKNGTISTTSSTNILWHFTKSKLTTQEDEDLPAIESDVDVYTSGHDKRRQLMIKNDAGSTGIKYVVSGNGFNIEDAGNNKFKLSENNCETTNNYIGFHITKAAGEDFFCSTREEEAIALKIYKVSKKYNYTSSKFLTDEETAAMEDVSVNKEVSKYKNYNDTAIAEVKLSTKGTDYDKTCDIVLILDDSTSVYVEAPDSSDKTRAQIIREDAMLFAEKILEINPENRISVIKFGREITNEDAVDYFTFSNDIDDIEEMIGSDKTYVSNGTDYTAAFQKANEIMEEYSEANHGKLTIFLSDGMPSKYNGISYSVYSQTSDATGIATNWINYVTQNPLQEAELMKQTGTTIYTIGALTEDTSLNDQEGYIIPAGTSRTILTNIANGRSNFYEFDKIETELEEIFEKIAKDFNYYPTNAVVHDNLTSDINLLTKTVQEYVPKIVFKKGDTVLETITFSEDGTKAYSSFNPDTNILESGKFEGEYISFDGNTIKWDIGDLYKFEYTLEFPIYLNNTVDLYGEGKDRVTGKYDISETTKLVYTDVTGDEVTKDFEKAALPWTAPTDSSSMDEDKDKEEPKEENATNVKTGDNTLVVVGSILLVVIVLNIYKRRTFKTKRKNNNIVY